MVSNNKIARASEMSRTSNAAEDRLGEHALNYVLANRFYVEINGSITACFTECSGLGVEIAVEPHAEGGLNNQQRLLIGSAKFENVTLKRGVTNDLMFWSWIEKTLKQNSPERRNVNILIFNQAGETMQTWKLLAAFPVKWSAPALQADANEVAVEELSLAYEGLEISKGSQGRGAQTLKQRDERGYFT
ncbi:MAG: phage tail protein [Cyanobacteria bacterium SID2]|nr:phage tail protein [Cyanobacteria bacterium SID2]MBP0003724.1 phage tail protein [Cyanobacteria bacterium SBC]